MSTQSGSSVPGLVRAMSDPHLLRDPRVLMNLLAHEKRQRAESQSRFCMQPDVTLGKRKELAHWMLKVCELQQCEEGVFSLAMSYVRICLSLFPVRRDHLRLLGTTCLFIASKMKTSAPLSLSTLEFYTGYTVPVHKILEWEPFIVKKLNWDLAIIIPHDFLEHILERVTSSLDMRDSVHKNAVAYLTLCTSSCILSKFAPSSLAVVCIAKAMWDLGFIIPPADDLFTYLSSLAEITTEEFLTCKTEIESALHVCNLGDHNYVNPSVN